MLSLACTALHPSIPALDVGVRIGLNSSGVHVPPTPTMLGMLIAAIRAHALIPEGGGSFWDEWEAESMATYHELLARADHLLLNCHHPAAAARGAA